MGRDVSFEEMAAALRKAFAEALKLRFEDVGLSHGELALAQALERDKYADPGWTWER